MESENHHLTNSTAIIVPGKNDQWVLKSVGTSMRNKIFTWSQSMSPKTLTITKGEIVTSKEKRARHRLNQVVKVSVTSWGPKHPQVPPDVLQGHEVTSVLFVSKTHHLL